MITVNFVNFMRAEKRGNEINRPRGSGDFLFLYFPKPMRYGYDDNLVITESNACILLGPNDSHRFSGAPEFINSFVHFSGSEAEAFDIPTGKIFYPACYKRLNELTQLIKTEIFTGGELSAKMCHHLVCELLILIKRSSLRKSGDTQLEAFERLRYEMLSECGKRYSCESLAARMSMSKTVFYKYYKKYFASTPKKDIINARMEKASVLLTDSNKTVAAVADEVGFASAEHFTRFYTAYYGTPPRRVKANKTSL